MSALRSLQIGIFLCVLQAPAPILADPIIIQGSTTFARHLLANQKQKLEADSGVESL